MRKILPTIGFLVLFFILFVHPAKALAYSISGTVFVDSNQDEIQDAGETGYGNGLTVTLTERFTGHQTTVTTDSNGHYTFTDVSASNPLILQPNIPDGYTDTTDRNLAISTSNTNNIIKNFGIVSIPNNTFLTQAANLILSDIACPKSNNIFCVAVGYQYSGNGDVIMTTTDGTDWTTVLNDNITNSNIATVVCPNSHGIFCMASGTDNQGQEIWTTIDGVNWTKTVINIPSGNASITKIVCPDSDGIFCIAVTSRADILTTTNGTNWATVQNNPANSGDTLVSITCPNTGGILCIAVGNVNGNSGNLILTTTDGIDWTNIPNLPYPTDGGLFSIACPNSHGIFCIAVGATNSGADGTMLTTNDGTNWTSTSNSPLKNSAFGSIACPNSNNVFCVAEDFTGGISKILTTSDGVNWSGLTNWSSVSGLLLYPYTSLQNIVCPNSNGILCTTVGFFSNARNLTNSAAIWNESLNQPPIINPISNTTINQGATYSANGFFFDPDSTSWTGSVDYGDGSGTQSLTVSGINFSLNHQYNTPGTYTMTVSITDDEGATGLQTATITVNAPTPTPSLVTAINAGGDTQGNFVADTDFNAGTTYSSSATVDTSGVTNPAPQAVYQTVRFGNFTYTVPNLTPNTNYTLRLHFNELYFGANGNSGGVGSRVFNVSVNGNQSLSNFDIYQIAGGANKAIIEELPATSDSSGNITVQFSSVVDNAMVNGIEVDSGAPSTTPTPTPTPITTEAINAGGGTEGSFVSDIDSTGGSTFSTTASIDTTGVTSPAPESVYQSVRYGNFTYNLPSFAPNSSHTVRLHFSEPYWGTALSSNQGGDGSRVFNVSINGTQVLTNFDVFQTAGGADKAVVEEIPVTADSNGKISIQFTTVTDNAMVSGIEVN